MVDTRLLPGLSQDAWDHRQYKSAPFYSMLPEEIRRQPVANEHTKGAVHDATGQAVRPKEMRMCKDLQCTSCVLFMKDQCGHYDVQVDKDGRERTSSCWACLADNTALTCSNAGTKVDARRYNGEGPKRSRIAGITAQESIGNGKPRFTEAPTWSTEGPVPERPVTRKDSGTAAVKLGQSTNPPVSGNPKRSSQAPETQRPKPTKRKKEAQEKAVRIVKRDMVGVVAETAEGVPEIVSSENEPTAPSAADVAIPREIPVASSAQAPATNPPDRSITSCQDRPFSQTIPEDVPLPNIETAWDDQLELIIEALPVREREQMRNLHGKYKSLRDGTGAPNNTSPLGSRRQNAIQALSSLIDYVAGTSSSEQTQISTTPSPLADTGSPEVFDFHLPIAPSPDGFYQCLPTAGQLLISDECVFAVEYRPSEDSELQEPFVHMRAKGRLFRNNRHLMGLLEEQMAKTPEYPNTSVNLERPLTRIQVMERAVPSMDQTLLGVMDQGENVPQDRLIRETLAQLNPSHASLATFSTATFTKSPFDFAGSSAEVSEIEAASREKNPEAWLKAFRDLWNDASPDWQANLAIEALGDPPLNMNWDAATYIDPPYPSFVKSTTIVLQDSPRIQFDWQEIEDLKDRLYSNDILESTLFLSDLYTSRLPRSNAQRPLLIHKKLFGHPPPSEKSAVPSWKEYFSEPSAKLKERTVICWFEGTEGPVLATINHAVGNIRLYCNEDQVTVEATDLLKAIAVEQVQKEDAGAASEFDVLILYNGLTALIAEQCLILDRFPREYMAKRTEAGWNEKQSMVPHKNGNEVAYTVACRLHGVLREIKGFLKKR